MFEEVGRRSFPVTRRAAVVGMVTAGAGSSVSLTGRERTLDVGVCAHLNLYSKPQAKAVLISQLDAISQLHATIVRWDAPWSAVETERGSLQIPPGWDSIVGESNKRNIGNVMILDYGNKLYNGGRRPLSDEDIALFLRYAKLTVTHFRDQVTYFEIWNEWNEGNGGAGAGTPEEYLRFLARIYPALKAIAPHCQFLVGGVGRSGLGSLQKERPGFDTANQHFFERSLELGLLSYGDGISLHPYCRWGMSNESRLDQYRSLMSRVRETVRGANGGKSFPLYITEMGWPSALNIPMFSIGEDDQAKLLKGAIEITRNEFPDVQMFLIFQLTDMGRSAQPRPEISYGLIKGYSGKEPKKASYTILQEALSGDENGR